MSYQEQQKKVRAENEERERRKVEDELEQQNEQAKIVSLSERFSAVDQGQYPHNVLLFENADRKISTSGLSIEYEDNHRVRYLR